MPKDIPPLNALRAFEAAGRHLSITKAADELCVTAAAVSHQVKALEDYLAVRLFRRSGNSLFLTDAGQAFLPGLRAGFAELERRMCQEWCRLPRHVVRIRPISGQSVQIF